MEQGRFATGPTKFDPTGLRATMSVTWEETEKSLDTFMPDHVSSEKGHIGGWCRYTNNWLTFSATMCCPHFCSVCSSLLLLGLERRKKLPNGTRRETFLFHLEHHMKASMFLVSVVSRPGRFLSFFFGLRSWPPLGHCFSDKFLNKEILVYKMNPFVSNSKLIVPHVI